MTHPHLEGLIPCPFCGRAPKYSSRADWHSPTKESHFIACYCGGYSARAHQCADSRDAVVAAWNTRQALAALPGGGVDDAMVERAANTYVSNYYSARGVSLRESMRLALIEALSSTPTPHEADRNE